MFTHEEFGAAVEQHFQFLESDFAMRREPLHKADKHAWVAYGNGKVKVIVEYELGGYCSVSVQNVGHTKNDPLERSEFDLDEIVALSGARPRKQDPRAIAEVVARSAETLRTVGAPVLKGNFEALHERQRKAVEALRRHDPATELEGAIRK